MSIAALLAVAVAVAQGAPEAPRLGQRDIWKSNPEDVARALLNQATTDYREMEVLPILLSPDIRGVELFKAPKAVSVGLCAVDIVVISTAVDSHRSPNPPLNVRGVKDERRYKLVTRPPPAGSASSDALQATDAECRRLMSAKDFFVADTEDSIAQGAEVFREAVRLAGSRSRLPFKLKCEDWVRDPDAGKCARDMREDFALMDPGEINRVGPCPNPIPGKRCYSIAWGGERGWGAALISSPSGKLQVIELGRFPVPEA